MTNFRLWFHSRQLKLRSFQQRLRRDSSLLVLRLNSLLRHVHRRLVPTKRNSDDGASPKIFQLHRFCVPDNFHTARRLQLRSRGDNNFHQRRIITWSPLDIRIRSTYLDGNDCNDSRNYRAVDCRLHRHRPKCKLWIGRYRMHAEFEECDQWRGVWNGSQTPGRGTHFVIHWFTV